ncbi:ATP-binding protein [uncultured Deinococcus sp.]|uniref:ATP-binding protein n=1 Tax=uncultured Deinococcus sp. TaxID=158789 RepID=UPI0025877EDD|nr:ATP-binding protein [uncultured Deinococcus sp.]
MSGPRLPERWAGLEWERSPLGAVTGWPPALCWAAALVLAHPLPALLLWGEDAAPLYNAAYARLLGQDEAQPGWTGAALRLAERRHAELIRQGEGYALPGQPLPLSAGPAGERAFTLSYGPVPGEDGAGAGGVLVTATPDLGEQSLLPSILNSLGEAVIVCDAQGRIILSNVVSQDFHAQPLVSVSPQEWPAAYHLYAPGGERQLGPEEVPLYRAWKGETVHNNELVIRAPGQPPRTVLVTGQPVTLPDGTVGGLVAQRDITRRQQQERALAERTGALDAFAALTEAVGSETDVTVLAKQAIDVLRARFSGDSAAYYAREDGQWRAQVWSLDVRAELAEVRSPFSDDHPLVAELLATQRPVFREGEAAARDHGEYLSDYASSGAYPMSVGGQVLGVLAVARRGAVSWTEGERAILRAVGRSLRLALERSEAARALEARNAELHTRTRWLESFAVLSHDLTVEGDPYALVRRAQGAMLPLLPSGHSMYWELEGGRWSVRSAVGEVAGSPQAGLLGSGLPAGGSPPLDRPWASGQPFYLDRAPQGTPGTVGGDYSVAALPVLVGGQPSGVLSITTAGAHQWDPVDKSLLETVVRSLGLALERARGLEQLAAERRKLEAANEELEAFAYSVSHDLRTPVRHILGFNSLLRQSLGAEVSPRVTRYLDVVAEAGQRMNVLIDAMLDLSRTARTDLSLARVNLGELLASVRAEVEPDAGDRRVEWSVGELPTVTADADTLRQVFVNLLTNALKYTRPRELTRIEIWAERRGTDWALLVRDNGVGFDPRYAENLFGVFQRLHRADDFEGTGVGLANVRRIIARHGGEVFAQGEVGQGATFGFTLPGA